MSYALTGIPAAPGLARGPLLILTRDLSAIPREMGCDPRRQSDRLKAAREFALSEITELRASLAAAGHHDEAALFDAHAMFLNDPALLSRVQAAIAEGLNAEAAWMDGIEHFSAQLEAIADPTLSARAADVRDVGERVLNRLLGRSPQSYTALIEPVIIAAHDLTPSQTVSLHKANVLALCTAVGGPTSHTAILAKALGIPAVVGLGTAILDVADGVYALVDGTRGEVIVEPDEKALKDFKDRSDQLSVMTRRDHAAAHEPAITRDGHRVEIGANIGDLDELSEALEAGAEGIGLLRTEFLYLHRDAAPSETEQLDIYQAIFKAVGDRPVVARTLDVGGDKALPYLRLGRETNPFLGQRAIRISLAQPDLLKTQLRALLRAGVGHDLRIMFPMIATLNEVRQARRLVEQAAAEVSAAGQPMGASLQIGIMVETPAVALLADQFAREVDFFSIGTNDLTQYTMAADRTNERVAYLNDAAHPAVLRQIAQVIEAGRRENIWVGVCGELAGDPDIVPILLGLNIDELSMAPSGIPRIKAVIRAWSFRDAADIAGDALALDSAEAVRTYMSQRTNP